MPPPFFLSPFFLLLFFAKAGFAMNTRSVTIFLVLGMAAALLLTRLHSPRRLPLPVIGSPAVAQTPSPQSILVQQTPGTGIDDPWRRYQITVPTASPPLDMHVAFLVDGKGTEVVLEQPQPWPQPIPFQYRLDSDDDSRVKAILEAQGLPVKKNLVTYHFAAGANGWTGFDKTIQFQHEPGGNGETSDGGGNLENPIGKKIVLYSSIISDKSFKGSFEQGLTYDQWTQPGYAPKFPPGLVHHLSVYVMFQPHQGPPVKGNVSISRDL